MPEQSLLTFYFLVIVIIISFSWWSTSNRMQLRIPLNSKYAEPALEIYKNIRMRSSIEQFPVSYEIVSNAHLSTYFETLLRQHKHSDPTVREYIERIPFMEQGQQFFRTVSVDWHNSLSITLIAHKKYDDHCKIMIMKLSKKVTISLAHGFLSPITSLLGMTSAEEQQMYKMMTNLDQEENKQIMENTMMLIMGNTLRERYSNVLDISFVRKN